MKPLTEEQIWDILDGLAEPEIIEQHAVLMKENAEYRVIFNQHALLQEQLLKLDLEQPSMRFTQNIMGKVMPKVQTEVKQDRAPIYFLGGMFIMAMILIGLIFRIPSAPTTSELPINTEGVASLMTNSTLLNSFLIINLLLFFVVLDKYVLKPYFQKKLSSKG
jgi:hypothetical protein